MATNRTYGIEIEMASKVDRLTLAMKIQEAFDAAGIAHNCVYAGYSHNTDSLNTTRWEVQFDRSISTTDSHAHRIEIVSPVLSGGAGLEALKVVCDVATQYGKINRSCGLHIHHGVDNWDHVVAVSAAFSHFQDIIYKGLPPSRTNGRYSKKWSAGSLQSQIAEAKWNRYTGLNLCSFALRKTIEFRCAGGSTEFEKISNWVLFTQGLVEAAVAGRIRTSSDINGLVDFVGSGANDYQSIRGKKPSKRSRIAAELNRLVAEGCHTRENMQTWLVAVTGCAESSAASYITDCLNPKYNTLKTRVVVEDGIYKFAEDSRTADADYQQAATWFQGRYNHFQNAA